MKNMYAIVRVGLAATASAVGTYYMFQQFRNKKNIESGRRPGNQHQDSFAGIKSSHEDAQSYNKLCIVKRNYNSMSLSGNLFLTHAIGNSLPILEGVEVKHKLIAQKVKAINEQEKRVVEEEVVKKVNNSSINGHTSVDQNLKTIKQVVEEEQKQEEKERCILTNRHSNGPSSEQPIQPAKINNIKLAEVHKRSSRVAKLPPIPSPSSNHTPVKAIRGRPTPPHSHPSPSALGAPPPPPPPPPSGMYKITKKTNEKLQKSQELLEFCTPVKAICGKPTPPHSHPSPTALGAAPPPPPPPPSKKKTNEKLQKSQELLEFYHLLTKKELKKESATQRSATTNVAGARSNLIAEIEKRSPFLLLVKADVEAQGELVQSLATQVRAAAYIRIENILSFVKWLDEELSILVDERAVLKHFDWPESKADALREAAFEYQNLKKLETEVTSFVDDQKLPCEAASKMMYCILEKIEKRVHSLRCTRDTAIARYKSFGIPIDWILDTGVVGKIKLASVKLATAYMRRVASELNNTLRVQEEHVRDFILLQCVRFALQVHQFARGLDVECIRAFEELRGCAITS